MNEFKLIFDEVKAKVRAVEGCHEMILYREAGTPNVYFTISTWASEEHLDAYRHSALFQDSWARMRVLFSGKAQAFTVVEEDRG